MPATYRNRQSILNNADSSYASSINLPRQQIQIPSAGLPHPGTIRRFRKQMGFTKNVAWSSTDDISENRDVTVPTLPKNHRLRGKSVWRKFKDFILEFLLGSSIHGFVYLAKVGLSVIERVMWFAFICLSIFSIASLSARTWNRFQTSPMVISMDRNKLSWNTSFPTVTVCPTKTIDRNKFKEYVRRHPQQFANSEDIGEFWIFIQQLAKLSYDNIELLPMNRTFGIDSANYLDVIHDMKWNFTSEVTTTTLPLYTYETVTEFGICYSVNSEVALYNSYKTWKKDYWGAVEHSKRVKVHPLDGEIYTQLVNMTTGYVAYFHSGNDVAVIGNSRYSFPKLYVYTTIELTALEIYTSEDARDFTVMQRSCRYTHEGGNMQTVPIYSRGLCMAECRMFFVLKKCGCVPHFYRNRLRNGDILPVCDFSGLRCVQEHKDEIFSLNSECNCISNCDESNFLVQAHRSRRWFLGSDLEWGYSEYPKMQLRRDVLFSFADVLVYIGGLVGFFLGCSVLSFTEILYYFTARLARRLFSN